MTQDSEPVAVALAELRGEISTGLARIEGSLGVLMERSQRAERDITQLREDAEGEMADLRAQVEALKAGRWPLPALGVLTGVGALVVTLWELVVGSP